MKKLIILVVALVMAFAALPAFAQDKADWAFYGSVRMWTAWEQVDNNAPPQLSSQGAPGSFFQVGTTKAMAYTIGGNDYSNGDLAWLLQSNSRIGANVKWGNVGGAFEYGHTTTPTLRLLYGTWDFTKDMRLLVGQDYGSYFYLVSNMCGVGGGECNGIGYGSIYPGRVPQLKLISGGFKFSLEQPQQVASFQPISSAAAVVNAQTLLLGNNETLNGGFGTASGNFTNTGFLQTDLIIPRIAASYTFNWGPGQFFLGGQYNTFKEIYNAGGVKTENTVVGWTLGIGTKLAFGPFYVNATGQYGQNPNNAGTGPTTLYPSVQLYDVALDKDESSDYYSGQLILGFKLTDSMTFEGGVIYQNGSAQNPANGNDIKQSTWTYYVQAAWSPVKNVFIIPEAGIVDFGKLSTTNNPDLTYGNMWWVGAKWQINF